MHNDSGVDDDEAAVPTTLSGHPEAPVPDWTHPWKTDLEQSRGMLTEMEQNMKNNAKFNVGAPVLRVNQLDAMILDNELFDILKSQFVRIFAFFREDFVDRFKPEIEASLKTMIFQISILARNYSYGQELQNLTFGPLSLFRKFLLLFFTVGVPYLWQRWFHLYQFIGQILKLPEIPNSPAPSTIRLLHSLEKLFQLLSTVNFFVFLWNGAYVSIVHRILAIKQFYLRRQMARRVGFEYMNRQLLWNGFTEFMLFIVPIIPIGRIAKGAKFVVSTVSKALRIPSGLPLVQASDDKSCPICHFTINIPYTTNCGHRYCYYCIQLAMLTEGMPSCTICGSTVTKISRVINSGP